MATPLPASASDATTGRPNSAKPVLLVLSLITAAFLAWKAYSPMLTARPTEAIAFAGRPLNLNSANRNELLQVPGIGPSMADAILAHRREHGRFESLDELDRVHGVGPKTLDKLRPWLTIDPMLHTVLSESVERLERKPAPTPAIAAPPNKLLPGQGTLNINTATLEQLQKLPGIGPKLAERIVAERTRMPIKNLEDLKRVGGIGVKTMDKLKPLIRFGD